MKKLKITICSLLVLCSCFVLSACGENCDHTFETKWTANETHHWHAATCEHVEEKKDYAEHVDTNKDGMCDVCMYGAQAVVGNVNYNTLELAFENAEAGSTITLYKNFDLQTGIIVTKEIVLDLNGKNLSVTNDTEGVGVFWVKAGGKLTINGDGVINGLGNNAYSIAIWADGGEVIINGGSYTNVGATSAFDSEHFDLIYVKNGGRVTINGGNFKCETPKWTLNSNDTLVGTIVVKGGVFAGFDPSNADTEPAPNNPCSFVADGYKVVSTEIDQVTYYTVVADAE